MTIIAFSDVHLGYEESDSESFKDFLEYLESREDITHIVIVGDFIDLWRRDVVGLGFELSSYIEKLRKIQMRCKVHYVIGNHDFHMRELKRYVYPFRFRSSLSLRKLGYKLFFLHGFQCDPLQMIAYPTLLEVMCWTLSDDIGVKKSNIWDVIHPKKLKITKEELDKVIDNLYQPPETKLRMRAYGIVEEIVQCIRKTFKKVKKDEFIVYGHTHRPGIFPEDRIANTGSWVKDSKKYNTYFEFTEWPPQVKVFKGKELQPQKLRLKTVD